MANLLRGFGYALLVLVPVAVAFAVALYVLDPFDPAALPIDEITGHDVVVAPRVNGRLLLVADLVASGKVVGPEDLAFDPEAQVMYTGCADGWIKRVTVTDSVVENWVHTGGRPLGLVIGLNREVIVADADQGLLNVTSESEVKLLAAGEGGEDGKKFKLTDGVDVARDGTIYFTDASDKYGLAEFIWDALEGKPHGRLMSFNPTTGETKVLLRHLYFANGVAVSPDQKSVVFCESIMRRCRKYNIDHENEGSVDTFVEHLPGFPDNIRYDAAKQCYWIALFASKTPFWDIALRYPMVRKVLGVIAKHIGAPQFPKNSGVIAVDLEGKPTAHYYDPALQLISTGITVGDHLYLGCVTCPYIIRLNITQHPAI
ncbi:hypothetical protein Dimus_017021 [Dionaea muscipula]